MNPIDTYTSTGCKLMYHPEVIQRIQEESKGTPVSIQIAPTSLCNLNCEFCSNSKRKKREELEPNSLFEFLKRMKTIGTKTVEWTGGGDPTLYSNINEMIIEARDIGFKQGMISNGLAINSLKPEALRSLYWLRISMNGLDYGKTPQEPDRKYFRGTLGFSYVWNDKTTPGILSELDEFINKFEPSYVRIVPNCLSSYEEQERNNRELNEKVAKMGAPYFFQEKTFNRPEKCWWYLFKPFVLHDGWVYPCSSIVLNDTADRQFHNKYRVSKMENFHKLYDNKMTPRSSENCSHCVFYNQNETIDKIYNPHDMKDFV